MTMRKKILIVEDETLLLNFITDYIESNPWFEIAGACTDGFEALSQCAASQPDLVILDLHLPGLNGIEVLKKLGKESAGIKVLVFSSAYTPSLLRQAYDAGADGFIDKIAGLKEFNEALETILKGGKYFSDHVKALMVNNDKEGSEGLSATDLEILDQLTENQPFN